MILDKSGKLFGKINIIDLGVILAVLLVVVGVVVRFSGSAGKITTQTTNIEYQVRVQSVREQTVNALQKKGRVTNKKYTDVVGEIKDVQVTPAKQRVVLANGQSKEALLPDRYDCLITIECDGKETKDGYFNSNNEELSTGRDYEIYSKYISTAGTIVSVKTK